MLPSILLSGFVFPFDGMPEPVFYNGYRGADHFPGPTEAGEAGALPGTLVEAKGTSAARALGVENMAVKALQGRAVMIDLFAHFGIKQGGVSQRAATIRKAAGFDPYVPAWDLRLGSPELLVSGRRRRLIELRERYATND